MSKMMSGGLGTWTRYLAVAGAGAAMLLAASAGASAAAASSVSCTLAATPSCQGLTIEAPHVGDSLFTSSTVGGKSADVFSTNTTPGNNPVSYIYFQVAKSSGLLSSNPTTLYLTVEYYNALLSGSCVSSKTNWASCLLLANYGQSGKGGPYANSSLVYLTGQQAWTTTSLKLTNVQFTEAENNGADFRLAGVPNLAVHKVTLSLTAPAPSSATTATASTSASSSGSTSSSTPSSSTPAKSSSLPQTGGGPLPWTVGALLLGGGALLLRRPRR